MERAVRDGDATLRRLRVDMSGKWRASLCRRRDVPGTNNAAEWAISSGKIMHKTVSGCKSEDGMPNGFGLTRRAWSGPGRTGDCRSRSRRGAVRWGELFPPKTRPKMSKRLWDGWNSPLAPSRRETPRKSVFGGRRCGPRASRAERSLTAPRAVHYYIRDTGGFSRRRLALVAQLAAHPTCNREVGGFESPLGLSAGARRFRGFFGKIALGGFLRRRRLRKDGARASKAALARVTLTLALSRQGRGDLLTAILAWFRMDAVRYETFAISLAKTSLIAPRRCATLLYCNVDGWVSG